MTARRSAHRRPRFILPGVVGCILMLGSCGGAAPGSLTVLAAASLTDALPDVVAAFEAQHDGIEVSLGFAGSSTLVAQILAGAPADVFAAADQRTMDRLVDAGAVTGDPVVFATNLPTIVVPPGNPAGIAGPADLGRSDVVVSLCAPEVPCGALAAAVFARAGLAVPDASRETDVRAVLSRVELGEADAGVVYVTDAVLAAGRVEEIPLVGFEVPVTGYPVAALVGGSAAADFVDFMTSAEAKAILAGYGFGPP